MSEYKIIPRGGSGFRYEVRAADGTHVDYADTRWGARWAARRHQRLHRQAVEAYTPSQARPVRLGQIAVVVAVIAFAVWLMWFITSGGQP